MINPRDARIAGCALLLLAGGVVANVVYLQGNARERRKPVIPVGMNVPLPGSQSGGEVRRSGGAVTLSLASLIEAGQRDEGAELPAMPSSAPSNRMTDIAQAIDRISPPTGQPLGADRGPELVRQIQTGLAARGYEPGPADGDAGLLTRAAILAFEHDLGLAMTGDATEALLSELHTPSRRSAGASKDPQSRTATGIIRTVQQQLIAVGYLSGVANGQLDARTANAIRAFEAANDLMPSGRISAPMVARLQRTGIRRAKVASGR